jgi:hypothetical protein
MTKGKIVNKQTGLEIHGDIWVQYIDKIQFLIDGDYEAKSFAKSLWEFIEDKPSTYEQYLALKPGARFTVSGTGGPVDDISRIKLDDDTYAFAYGEESGEWSINDALNFDLKSLTIEEVTD